MGVLQNQLNQTLRTASVSIAAVKGAGNLDAKQKLKQERKNFATAYNKSIERQEKALAKAEEYKQAAKVMQDRLKLFKQGTVIADYEKLINTTEEKYKEQEDK